MNRLLLLEDDISLVDGLVYTLEKNGFCLDVARTIREARNLLQAGNPYDLLLFDVTLPDGSGFHICEELRATGNQVPILFLTASDEEINIIRGLDSGGDDYMTKPFRIGELCSCIRALLRRSSMSKNPDSSENNVLKSGATEIHLASGKVYQNGILLELTGMEYRLLCLLLRSKGQILTRNVILNELWDGNGSYVDDNTLSVYIRRLREKIERVPSQPEHIMTVPGFGYRWKEADT